MTFEELAARQEISEVLFRYCRGVDRLDEALVRGIYHDGAYDDHGYWKGPGKEFARFVVDRLRTANTVTTHSISNILIDLAGAFATVESQVQVTLRRRVPSPAFVDVMGARYIDLFAHRDGCWRIDERTVVLDWHKVEQWDAAAPPIPLDDFTTGRRDDDDPVYIMQRHRTLQRATPAA